MSSYLTIGTYDGVHLGHQKIIKTLIRESLKRGLASALAYFPLPPRLFFSNETENCLITLPGEREELIRRLRVEHITEVPFDSVLAEMSAEKFFNNIILKAHGAAGLCVGQDFAFGKGRRGSIEFLRRHCAAAGIRFKAMSFVTFGGHKISSSLIRTFLRNGRVEEANKCLGWNYSASGKVIRGAGLGRRLGFPTANIAVHPAKILPPGIFAAKVRLDKEVFYGVVNVGRRPTVDSLGGRLLLEVHILDFDRDIYGRRLETEFLRHLRPEHKFGSKEALQRQILQDIRIARKYFVKRKS
jgi:riboflavin kinase/FMN adenylyltransferase